MFWTKQFLYSCLSDGGKIALFGWRKGWDWMSPHTVSVEVTVSQILHLGATALKDESQSRWRWQWKAIAQDLPIRYLYSHHVFMALDLLCSCIYTCVFPNSHTMLFSIFHLTIFHERKTYLFYSIGELIMFYCWKYVIISSNPYQKITYKS